MKRYIKAPSGLIIIIFTWHNRPEFDGTEIEFDNNWPEQDLLINGKNILNEFGTPIFTWDGENAIERSQSEIDSDPEFIQRYKVMKKTELNNYIGDNLLDVIIPGTKSLDDIVAQWNIFKKNASSWTTKQDVDTAFETAIDWLTE